MTKQNQATAKDKATLMRLSDTELTVANPDQDIRGRKVIDKNGEEIGEVSNLLIDNRETRVRFLEIAFGGFFGIGEKKILIPVDAIAGITSDKVKINQSREYLAGAPDYNPELIDERYLGKVYGYYGYAPYWGPGYVYPPYPYFP